MQPTNKSPTEGIVGDREKTRENREPAEANNPDVTDAPEKEETGLPPPKRTARAKGRVVLHKNLVSGGCSCGTDCPVAGYGQKRSPRMEVDEGDRMTGGESPALRAQMETFMAMMDKKWDRKLDRLAKSSDVESILEKIDGQAADITRLKFALEDQRSANRQERHELKEEMKRYADDLFRGRGSKKQTRHEPMEEVEEDLGDLDDEEPIENITPRPANPRYRQTGVRFNNFDERRTKFLAGARSAEQEESRIKKFDVARRSLRIWPIEGNDRTELSTNLSAFLRGALNLSQERISDLGIEKMERTGIADNNVVHKELLVFSTAAARDFVSSRGPSLASYVNGDRKPTAGFRVEVPDYLGAEWKLLDDVGYQLKREHGPETRKYIKFDEYNYRLYLEVKLQSSNR